MLYTYVFPRLSTTLGTKSMCFNTPSDVLVERHCIVKYFLQCDACKTVNWASTYRSCLCLTMPRRCRCNPKIQMNEKQYNFQILSLASDILLSAQTTLHLKCCAQFAESTVTE